MPVKSKSQFRLFKAAENNPKVAKKLGMSQSKAAEMTEANVGKKSYSKLPKKMADGGMTDDMPDQAAAPAPAPVQAAATPAPAPMPSPAPQNAPAAASAPAPAPSGPSSMDYLGKMKREMSAVRPGQKPQAPVRPPEMQRQPKPVIAPPPKPMPVKSPIQAKPVGKPIAKKGEEKLRSGEIRMYKHGGAVTSKVSTAQKGKKSKSGW